MVKKDPAYKKPQDPKSFGAFLKKRAPIYLGLIGLFFIFAYPAITEKNLDSLLDNYFEGGDEKIALDMVMSYAGENGTGLTIKDVIEEKINEKYSDQKIFDKENTRVVITVDKDIRETSTFTHEVGFHFYPQGNDDNDFEHYWVVNIETGEVSWAIDKTKNIVQLVEYAD